MITKYKVCIDENAQTLEYLLKNKFKMSKKLIKNLKTNKSISINGIISNLTSLIQHGDIILISNSFDDFTKCSIIPENKPINIIYEDEFMLIVDKDAGIVVHPTFSNQSGTLANRILNYYMENNSYYKIRPLYRLDKDTSGVILFAKNQYIQDILIKQSWNGLFKKEYLGIAIGIFKDKEGIINEPIARKENSIMLREISKNGKPSITYYSVIKDIDSLSLVRFKLITGRTHQIRVHCAYIGHPLIGDSLYNNDFNSSIIKRHALHSYKIEFIHPITNKVLKLKSPIPHDMENVIYDNYH